jgi:murein DD-endopeptidase MepM/ murein hydrolase activator NlpD
LSPDTRRLSNGPLAWAGRGTYRCRVNSDVRGSRARGSRRDSFARSLSLAVLCIVALGCAAGRAPVATTVERPAPAGPAGVRHRVERGQTLWRIARVYGVPLDELAQANRITDPTSLEVGRELFVPGALAVLHVPPHPEPLPGAAPSPVSGVPAGWPVENGYLLSPFGAPRSARAHQGIDIGGEPGQTVHAAWAGRVVYSAATMRGYGKTVILDHGDGTTSLYAHNSDLLVVEGSRVERGQPIARIGRSGNASAVHCHFEVRRDDVPVDPLPLLGAMRAER